MSDNKILLSRLVYDWLKEVSEMYTISASGAPYHGIHGIHCVCHRSPRALSVIMDEDLEVRIFPHEDHTGKDDRDSWVFLHPEDPEFFPKFLENLNIAHATRVSEIKRPDPGLGHC